MKLFAVLFVASLTACTSQYIQPTSGAIAEIRIRYVGNEAFALVHTSSNANCEELQAVGVIGSKAMLPTPENDKSRGIRPLMLGSTGRPEAETLEITMPAERPVTLVYTQIGPHDLMVTRSCILPITFTPNANEQYEVQFRSGRQVCSAEVFQLHQGETGTYRSTPIPAEKGSKECKPTGFK